MNNALLSETRRIKEIMGLITEKDLLSEGPGGGLDDLLRPLVKALKNNDLFQQMDVKYFDDILKAAKNSTDAVGRSFDNIVDGQSLRQIFDSLDDAGKAFVVRNLIKQGIPEFDNVVIDVVWSALGATSEQEFKTFAKTYKSVDEFIDFMTTDSDIAPEVVDVLRRYYNSNVDVATGAAARGADGVADDAAGAAARGADGLADDAAEAGTNIVKKTFNTELDVLEYLLESVGMDKSWLLKIQNEFPQLYGYMTNAARRLVGKNIDEVTSQLNAAVDGLLRNEEFKKFHYEATRGDFRAFVDDYIKPVLDFGFLAGRRNKKFHLIRDENGKKLYSVPLSMVKTTNSVLLLYAVYDAFRNMYEGMTIPQAVADAWKSSYATFVGVVVGSMIDAFKEKSNEAGDLTAEEARTLFKTNVADKLGKTFILPGETAPEEGVDYVLAKIERGVWKAEDFTGNPPVSYAIIKHSGETQVIPWTSEMEGIKWGDILSIEDKWNEFRAKHNF